ncbi:hypothetical protein [Streptomyces sp. FIT100]|nr:hypothetical protein [Streptomyces sp. FIT100]UUN29803.1 hypothetical protein KK483_28070 [Streptomyces sp. FIT100]
MNKTGAQTLSTPGGNKPRWGTYGSEIANVDSANWINALRMGTTSGDVD